MFKQSLRRLEEIFRRQATLLKVVNELLKVALDPKTKAYAKVSACESIFRIIQVGVQDTEMREKLENIKEQLSALEKGGPTVIDV